MIHGRIEIDGHVFLNDTCKAPIIYQANLDGITIIDTLTKQTYTHRHCEKQGCKIIHLSKYLQVIDAPIWRWWDGKIHPLNGGSVTIPCKIDDEINTQNSGDDNQYKH